MRIFSNNFIDVFFSSETFFWTNLFPLAFLNGGSVASSIHCILSKGERESLNTLLLFLYLRTSEYLHLLSFCSRATKHLIFFFKNVIACPQSASWGTSVGNIKYIIFLPLPPSILSAEWASKQTYCCYRSLLKYPQIPNLSYFFSVRLLFISPLPRHP